jgi:hypothetical protein
MSSSASINRVVEKNYLVGPFADMDNPVGKSLEFPLLIEELSIALFVPYVLCLVVHVNGRREKNCSIRYYDRDNSQNKTKAYVDSGSLRSK